MFKKSAPAPKNVLADRIRRVTEAASPPTPSWFTEQQQVDSGPIRPESARAPRQAVYRHGVIVLGGGERLSVAIRNLSATGARIEFHIHIPLPREVVVAEPTLKLRRRARVVWQIEGAAGLEFI
ncbi:MAG: hypothetical protein JNJ73_10080 [Hyphomonadaceae bacterium]|nr:hypothetical protein [Hyphomonadaceae bacterium]